MSVSHLLISILRPNEGNRFSTGCVALTVGILFIVFAENRT